MISKEELILQHQNKQKQIEERKEIIVGLQQQIAEKQKTLQTLNQKNITLIEQDVPSALTLAKTLLNPSVRLNTDVKQDVLDYIQELVTTLSKEKQHNQELLEKSRKLNTLLEQVNEHLKSGYNKNTLVDLTDKAEIKSAQHPKNTGFALLLEILEENPSKYKWTWDKTDRENLLQVVPQKLYQVAYMLEVDQETAKDITLGLEKLEQIKTKLVKNYEELDTIPEEIVQLNNESRIQTEAVEELNAQLEVLERQIKELEERERQEQQEKLKLEQQRQEPENERRKQERPIHVRKDHPSHIKRQKPKVDEVKKEREALVLELKKELTTYVNGRNQHYYPKDFFLPRDKKTRDQFIELLVNEKKGLFNKYIASGNSQELLKIITTKIDKFHGIKMQAALNRIVVKLIEADLKPPIINDPAAKPENVISFFKKKGGKYAQYAAKMVELYTNIDGMRVYAKTLPPEEQKVISQLIDALKNDVDQFISHNPEQLPSNVSYQKFKMTVKARLHSHDDLMSGHRSWQDTILNVLLSVITIGKLLYSKAITKRASLFFDKAEDQKGIEAPVDGTLEDLGTILTAG
ncbi:hypothetical protein [Legionella sp. WA2022007384]